HRFSIYIDVARCKWPRWLWQLRLGRGAAKFALHLPKNPMCRRIIAKRQRVAILIGPPSAFIVVASSENTTQTPATIEVNAIFAVASTRSCIRRFGGPKLRVGL